MVKLIPTTSDNVYLLTSEGSKKPVTRNLVPGMRVYDEKLLTIENIEYRLWEPFRSKLAAIILKGSTISIKKDQSVLYLGAANGTTVSHVSDIVTGGTVFAVEFSPRAMHDLIRASTPRFNLVPILADAMRPETYQNMVSQVDLLYQDVAQRDQAEIAIRNAGLYLKKKGLLVLIIKARSIDSTKRVKDVIDEEVKKLEGYFEIRDLIDLLPFDSDHAAVVARKI